MSNLRKDAHVSSLLQAGWAVSVAHPSESNTIARELTERLPVLARLRGLELWDRARTDALDLVSSVGRGLGAGQSWTTALDRWRPEPRHRMMPLLEAFAAMRPTACFIQIGAHDGQQQDPLRELVLRHGWSGIMVEPVPYVFERLQRHYGHLPRLTLENVAIGPDDGTVPFYHLADTDDAGRPGLPIWFDALGSLRREVVSAHQRFIPDIEERIVETAVPSLTFDSLCRRHDITKLDLLQTDTEGYDYEILRRIDFDRVRPKLIIYERVHLGREAEAECAAYLDGFGYATLPYELDTWCLNPGALDDQERATLLPLWRWLSEAEERQRPLRATRAVRGAARSALRRNGSRPEFPPQLSLTESEQRYLSTGVDDRTPLPPDADIVLSQRNPKLLTLREAYGGLDIPAVQHHMWNADRVADHVDLTYFRGDNLYVWHYPEHPRAMSLTLFLYMRYLESRGAGTLLDQLDEDGAFGCWTTDIAGYGKISRDLLDSVSEMLFLDRQLGLFSKQDLRVLDIGAGYGRLAYRIASAHPSLADYCCVDAIPESTFVADYYLQFRGCSPPARVLSLDRVQSDLVPGEFDLAVNIHSFSECTLAAIEWWVGQLARLEVPRLFVVPNEAEGLLSREAGGGYHDALPTLAAAGYRPVACEKVIDDPAIRDLVRINDNYYLFERTTED